MKTVLITGAAKGIGAACAALFAEKGYNVAVNYLHSRERAEELCRALREKGFSAEAFGADCSSESEVERLFTEVEASFGHIDVLVNNAGTALWKLLPDTTPDEWDRLFANDLRGAYLCCRRILPDMIRRKKGSIVNISSVWGEYGASCEVAYSAAKAGIIGLTKALSKEVGPSGVRVNCVSPGVIDTEMNAIHSAETLAALADETPLCRIGQAAEVAQAVFFLASDAASFITGQTLAVNGGMM